MADRSVVVRLIADTSSYNNQMRGAARTTREVGTAGKFTEDRLGDLKKVVAGFAVGAVIKAGVEFDALKQRSQAAFTTITGSSAAANQELSSLYANFKNNPFGYPQILKSSQQLLAMGTSTKDLVREMRDLSDATAAVGGNAELMDRVALALGQMRAKGTIQAEEMRQLAENGIPAWQMLAHEIGVSVPEAMKMVERRQVDSQRGIDALLKGIEDRFGGATANLRNTWTGTLTAFKTEAVQAGGEIVKPLMRIGTDGMHAIEPLLHAAGQVGSAFSGLPTPMQNTTLALAAVMLMSNRLSSAWTSTIGVGTRFADQIRVQQALAATSGVQISRMSAAMTVARMRASALGAGMLGAFGGPVGLAIVGATLGLSIYQQRQQEAAAAVARHKAEVQGLTSEIDRNTLSLNRNAGDTKLASLTYGDGAYKVLDFINQLPGAAQLARKAVEGDLDALARLRRELVAANGGKFEYGVKNSFKAIEGAAKSAHEAMGLVADEMSLRIPDAASAAGVSAASVSAVFDRWRTKGGDLQAMLQRAGFTASDASTIFNILAGSANNAASGIGNLSSAAAQMQQDVANAAGQFASIGGAWDSAMSAAQASSGGSSGKTPSVSDDPAYKRAKKAYDDQARRLRHLKEADRDRLQPLKDAAKAEAAAATAAEHRAASLKKVADAAKKASNEAQDAVKKAQDQKDLADRNAHDAAALAAAIKNQAAHAGTGDQSAYAAAQAKADFAARKTAADQARAAGTLANASADAAKKKAASDAAQAAYKQAKTEADAARTRANAAKKAEQDLATTLDHIERRYERQHERLLDAKNRAERAAQRKSERATAGVGAAYGGMADKVDISLNQYLGTLQDQVDAQERWKDNLLTLAAKVPPGVAVELAKLGPQAAPLVQKLVDGTDRQLKRFVSLFGRTGTDASTAVSTELTKGMPLISAVATQVGEDAATKLATALGNGTTDVDTAMKALGATVGKNPLKVKLGLKNKKDINDALYRLTHPDKPWEIPMFINAKNAQVKGIPHKNSGVSIVFNELGGWVRGGTRGKDSVPSMNMPGEFIVREKYAQQNGPLLEAINSGRWSMASGKPMPQQAPSAGTKVIYVNGADRPSHTKHIEIGPILQQPGQSPRDLAREIDRFADLGNGN